MLTDKDIQEFKRLTKREYGMDISDDYARERLALFLEGLRAVYKPIKKEAVHTISEGESGPSSGMKIPVECSVK